MARRRRTNAKRRNPARTKRRGRRVSRRAPRRARRSGRRLRRNGIRDVTQGRSASWNKSPYAGAGIGMGLAVMPETKPARKRGKSKRKSKTSKALTRRRSASRLRKRAASWRKAARKAPKRSLRRSTAMTQARRLSTLSRVARKGVKTMQRSPVYKAMHFKSNPGMAGLIVAAKVLAPQAGVAAVAMVGIAMGGAQLGNRVAAITQLPAVVRTYARPISTTLLTGGAYLLADKFAPKYKGAVALGGLMAAVLQALAVAKGSVSVGPTASKALAALGLGDYTTVGGRAYAEGGMFREIGSYVGEGPETRQGGAYSTQRPRRSLDNATQFSLNGPGMETRQGGAYSIHRPRQSADNATEWSMNGADDNTEFAPGEGGVLSGGLFRGTSR